MYNPLYCTNAECKYHKALDSSMIIKKGKKAGKDGNLYQRYQCKACGKKFLSTSLSWQSKFQKPELVPLIYKLYTSGYSMRRIALDLEIDRSTVDRAFDYLASEIKKYHHNYITQMLPRTRKIVFDEMQSYEHSKHLPISVGVIRDAVSKKIISIRCCEMRKHWAIHEDEREIELTGRYLERRNDLPLLHEQMMNDIALVFEDSPESIIVSDKSTMYRRPIRENFPQCRHIGVKSITKQNRRRRRERITPEERYGRTLMASFNAMAAQLRAYCSRLGHKNFITTKTIPRLENHLMLMIARYNGYDIKEVLNQAWWRDDLRERRAELLKRKAQALRNAA